MTTRSSGCPRSCSVSSPAAAARSAALAWAGQFDGAASVALAAIKKAVDQGLGVDLDTGLKIEEQLFAPLFATEDRAIGLTSFLENGPGKAEFVGR